jgi:hypothetical protein
LNGLPFEFRETYMRRVRPNPRFPKVVCTRFCFTGCALALEAAISGAHGFSAGMGFRF